MKKIVTIIGARPQIIKSAAISKAIQQQFSNELVEVLVHTGQHYDTNMSEVFFDEMGIPKPNYNLGVGSGAHGRQTADMIVGIEEILIKEQPQALLVYGDTNSTLAGAVAASKLLIPIVHVEAGLRSFNKSMPEEVNRIVCDHLSTLLFSPTRIGVSNLAKEGYDLDAEAPFDADNPKVYHCGDVMFDNSLHFSSIADEKATVLEELGLKNSPFILCTIHRGNNTDNPERLTGIFNALIAIAKQLENFKLILPIHPRTKSCMQANLTEAVLSSIENTKNILLIEPVSFLNIIALEKNCELVITDSGGLQKEAFFFEKPCVILRPETEWVEIVENGNAVLADAHESLIVASALSLMENKSLNYPSFYGDGKAAEFICEQIIKYI